jgi:diketogulonate reductase-like aldo/keto reductase
LAYPAWRRGYPKIGPTRAHTRDLDIFDFELTDDDMTLIASLDTGASLFSIIAITPWSASSRAE